MDADARKLVTAALELRRSHSGAPAIDVLDEAMSGRMGLSPDFEDGTVAGGDHMDPAAPFGQLLRAALAPHIAVESLTGADGVEPPWGARLWESEVMRPFARRYRLWDGQPDRATWTAECSAQLRLRWPWLAPADAEQLAAEMSVRPAWLALGPRGAADVHVRGMEVASTLPPERTAFDLVVEGVPAGAVAVAAIEAAVAVFRGARMSPACAADGYFARDEWDNVDQFAADKRPTDLQMRAAEVWMEAQQAVRDISGQAAAGLSVVWRQAVSDSAAGD